VSLAIDYCVSRKFASNPRLLVHNAMPQHPLRAVYTVLVGHYFCCNYYLILFHLFFDSCSNVLIHVYIYSTMNDREILDIAYTGLCSMFIKYRL